MFCSQDLLGSSLGSWDLLSLWDPQWCHKWDLPALPAEAPYRDCPAECKADFAAPRSSQLLAMRNILGMHQLSRDELRAELVRLRGGAARL